MVLTVANIERVIRHTRELWICMRHNGTLARSTYICNMAQFIMSASVHANIFLEKIIGKMKKL